MEYKQGRENCVIIIVTRESTEASSLDQKVKERESNIICILSHYFYYFILPFIIFFYKLTKYRKIISPFTATPYKQKF